MQREFEQKKGLDFVSIVIIIFAVGLIAGGLYFLSSSFNTDKVSAQEVTTSSQLSSLENESDSNVLGANENNNDNNTTEEVTPVEESNSNYVNESENTLNSEENKEEATSDSNSVENDNTEESDEVIVSTDENVTEDSENENTVSSFLVTDLDEDQIVISANVVSVEDSRVDYVLNEKLLEYNNELRPWFNRIGGTFYLTGVSGSEGFPIAEVGQSYELLLTVPKSETFEISDVVSIKKID